MKAFITTDIDEENLKRLKARINEIVYEPGIKPVKFILMQNLCCRNSRVDIFISEGVSFRPKL
jgi:hypothetical protein